MIPINKQEPLKAVLGDGSTLLVHSIFHTIQGEGPYVGMPAVFIRLAGCNLKCPGCDTEYTHGAIRIEIPGIIQFVRTAHAGSLGGLPLVVITGGEPFRQNIIPLIEELTRNDYQVQVESNGTLSYQQNTWAPFEIVVSPKAGKVHPSLFGHIIAYKYVLDSDHISEDDGLPTSVLGMPAAPARPHPGFTGEIYVQPADEPEERNPLFGEMPGEPENEKNDKNLDATVKSAMKYGYRLCIQTHKIAYLE